MNFKMTLSMLSQPMFISLLLLVENGDLHAMHHEREVENTQISTATQKLNQDIVSLPEEDPTAALVHCIIHNKATLSYEDLQRLVTILDKDPQKDQATYHLTQLITYYQGEVARFQAALTLLNEALNTTVERSEKTPETGYFPITQLGHDKTKKAVKSFINRLTTGELDSFISSFLSKATRTDDELLNIYASEFLREEGCRLNYGCAARIHLRRAELGIAGAKDDFYQILINFHKLDANHSAAEVKKLYPICLQEIQKGDQKTKQLVEQNYTRYGFLEGIFEYYCQKGDEESVETAWNLYQKNKKIPYRDETDNSFIINYWAAEPLIQFYKSKADQGDLEACRRITAMAMPEETHIVSFEVATTYYAKALDLHDQFAREGLLNALKRLKTSDYDGVGLKPAFLEWVERQTDVDILVATGDALKKTPMQCDSSTDLPAAKKMYARAMELGWSPPTLR